MWNKFSWVFYSVLDDGNFNYNELKYNDMSIIGEQALKMCLSALR